MNNYARVPRFLTADGSRPMPRPKILKSSLARKRKPFKVIGPSRKSVERKRVWRPNIRQNQDEAISEPIMPLDGPEITVSNLSSDSFPSFENEDQENDTALLRASQE